MSGNVVKGFVRKIKRKVCPPRIDWVEESSFDENDSCPICNTKKYYISKRYLISDLREKWIQSYYIDPIGKGSCEYLEKRKCVNCHTYYYNISLEDSGRLYEQLQSINKGYYTENKWEYAYILSFLEKNEIHSLLEIGCGQGFFLDKINNAIDYVVGTELNEKAKRKCLDKGLNVYGNDLKKLNQQYDIVVSFQVMEHIKEPICMIDDMLELVKKGGYLVISNPNPEGILKEFEGILDIPPHHQLDFSKKSYEFIANKYNFEIVDYEREPLQYWQYEMYYWEQISKVIDDKKLLNMTYELAKNDYYGHSHLVIYRKL